MEKQRGRQEEWEERIAAGKKAHSLKNAAALLDVSVGHLRNENKRGRISFLKSGNRTLVADSELCRYVEQSRK